ncbi:type III-B CRISPR module RAMP protein Cmr6, partial [Acidianus hospitalis]
MIIDFLVNILELIKEKQCNINLFSALSLTSIVYNNFGEFLSNKQSYSANNPLLKYQIIILNDKNKTKDVEEKKSLFKR